MRCVAEVGYSRATIREIARAANMTSGSLYHYFPNKAELVKAAFLELAETMVPRLGAAAACAGTVPDKFMAVLTEAERVIADYPYASAFDRAIRVESPAHLQLPEHSDAVFSSLRTIVLDIVERAQREGALGPGVEVRVAADAVYALFQGLYEQAATTTREAHHATMEAAKMLLCGTLFDY